MMDGMEWYVVEVATAVLLDVHRSSLTTERRCDQLRAVVLRFAVYRMRLVDGSTVSLIRPDRVGLS